MKDFDVFNVNKICNHYCYSDQLSSAQPSNQVNSYILWSCVFTWDCKWMSLLLSLNYNNHNIAKVVVLEVPEDRPESLELRRV